MKLRGEINKYPLTKQEFLKTNPTATEIVRWNDRYPILNHPYYERLNKKEFLLRNPSTRGMRLWNRNNKNEQCTKAEFLSKNPNLFNITQWNKNPHNKKILN